MIIIWKWPSYSSEQLLLVEFLGNNNSADAVLFGPQKWRSDAVTQCKTVPAFRHLAKTHTAYNFHSQVNTEQLMLVECLGEKKSADVVLVTGRSDAVEDCTSIWSTGQNAFSFHAHVNSFCLQNARRTTTRLKCGCCYPLWRCLGRRQKWRSARLFPHLVTWPFGILHFIIWTDTFSNLNKII